jgi:aconitase A
LVVAYAIAGRVDIDFAKRRLVVHLNDNGKEKVGLDDFSDGFDNPPGWSEKSKKN